MSLSLLAPYLEQALGAADEDFTVRFSDTILSWVPGERALEVKATGVDLIAASGERVTRLPEILLALSGRALMRGIIAPASIDLIGPEVTVVRGSDGRLSFALGIESGEWFAGLIDELLQPPDPTKITGYLERISALRANVTLEDQRSRTAWHAPAADVALVRKPHGLLADLAGSFEVEGSEIEIRATAAYDIAGGETSVAAEFSGLKPTRLATRLGVDLLHAAHTDLAGTTRFTVDGTGAVSPVDFEVEAAAGFIDLPQYFAGPLRFDGVSARGTLAEASRIDIAELVIRANGGAASLHGTARFDETGVALSGEGRVENLSVGEIVAYWPTRINPSARAWFAKNVLSGIVEEATYRVNVPPEIFSGAPIPDDLTDATFSYSGGSAKFLRHFPPVTGAAGRGRLTGAHLEFTVEAAAIDDIRLSEGEIRVQGLNTGAPFAEIGLVGRGTFPRALELLDYKPLELAHRLNVVPANTRGLVAARARFEFPVRTSLAPEEVAYRAAANLRDAEISGALDDYDLSDADLQLRIDNGRVDGTGPVRVNGVPMQLVWRGKFGVTEAPTQLFLSGRVDEAARTALGFPATPFLTGPVAATFRLAPGEHRVTRTETELDLRDAHLFFPELRWAKAVAIPGTARFVAVREADGGLRLEDLEVRAADLEAFGRVAFAPDGAVRTAAFERLRYGLTDVTAVAHATTAGRLELTLDGPVFDFRPYSDELLEFDDASETLPLVLRARFQRLIVGDDLQLQGVNVEGSRRAGRWEQLKVGGAFAPGRTLVLALSTIDGRRRLDVAAADAGSLLRTLGIFETAVGGSLRLLADIRDDLPKSPLRGAIRVDDFRLIEAPTLTQILTLASPVGIADTFRGDGISFVRFEAPFELVGNVLSVGEARAVGPALGITMTGTVGLGGGEIDINGTVIPAYTINSLLGNIPILGTLLVGKEGEGVFALTYQVTGPTHEPQVMVNPLATLAPGFLRNFVSGIERGEGIPDAPPASAGSPR